MSHEHRLAGLRHKLNELSQELVELRNLRKIAFVAAPPMPQGGAPPMDPAMMQQGGMPPGMDPAMMQQGMPPIDPNTGQPMDPAMMQGGMPPGIDPATGQPMDPNAQAPGGAPPIDPGLIDQIVGLLEEMGQKVQEQGAAMEELKNAVTGELQDLGDQFANLEKRMVEYEATASATAKATPVGASW